MKRKLKHIFDSWVVLVLFAFSRSLPLDVASWIGGWLGRQFGPVIATSANRAAKQNLAMIYPDMDEEDKKKLMNRMWDNLGRNAAEFPHLPRRKIDARVNIQGLENLPTDGRPVLFISGHFGNWELTYPLAHNRGIPVALIYRHINNPYIDRIMRYYRGSRCASMIPKGHQGAMKIVQALKKKYSLALLVDQKMNDGIAVPFFGRHAMTAPAVAQLALRYNMPIIPARIVRKHGVHFEGTIFPPLDYAKTGDNEKDTLAIMTSINAMLEGWIRETPEQWFWVHRRWPKD